MRLYVQSRDKAKSIVRLKIEVVTPENVKVATIDPNTKTSDSPLLNAEGI